MPLIAMLTILTILFSLGLVGGRTTVTQPEVQPVYVKSGDTLDLTCEQSDGFNIQWFKADRVTRQYNVIDSNDDTGFIFLSRLIGKRVVQLMKENVTLNDEGSYRCAVASGYDMPYAIEVYVLQVDERPGLVTNIGNSSTISCVISTVEMVRVEAYWTRNDTDLEANPKKFISNITPGDNTTELTLTVKNVGESDVGIYQCNIKLRNGNKFIHNVNLYSYPQVKHMGRSKNLVAGLNLELVCKVWGWPMPNVTWEFENGRPLNWSDSRISVTPNGTLKIENVVDTDRAVYVCTAWTEIDKTRHQTSTSILVRVKAITGLPVSGGNVLYNETCVNVSTEIVCFFKGSEEPMAWDRAWQLCSSFNATLLVIRNRNDQDAVAKYIQSHGKNSFEVWTAGKSYTYSNWTWISGAELDKSFQVNSVQRREDEERDYAAFDSDFNFTALAASEELPCICQYEGSYCNSSGGITVTDKCLRFMKENRTWYEARNHCLLSKGDLAIIRNEDHEILKSMTLNHKYWIGLRKKSWRWNRNDKEDSNDEIKHLHFHYAKNGECITFDASGGKWTATGCARLRGVVCQRDQVKTSLAETADTSTETSHTFSLYAVIGVLVIIICIFIVVIVFVLKIKKGKSHHSECNQSSEQTYHETLYSNVSQAPADTYANAAANAVIDRSDDNGVEYAEIELLTPVQLEDEGTIQPPGISYTSLAANEQMEDGGANRQPRTTYLSLASKDDPEYMEVVQNRARSTASRKVGPLGDMYAMPGCKGQAVTSPGIESASQPVKVIREGETVYANLQTDLPG